MQLCRSPKQVEDKQMAVLGAVERVAARLFRQKTLTTSKQTQ
jgi:hypothetical protein